jgi:D-alanyl-lipoteichoic acid acyltransferase DltB (MBOAT superfamily)
VISLFPTVSFAVFFAIVLPLSWLLMRRRGLWKGLMLVASYVFYASAGWPYVFLLMGSTLANQGLAVLISGAGKKRTRGFWLAAAAVVNLGLLAYFKYYDFFIRSADNLLADLGIHYTIPIPNVVLPAAISFFTFQALSYVIDTYRGKIEPSSLPDFAVYLSFFPHLLAGPIVRAAEFLPQLLTKRDPRRVDAGLAFWLIAGGLFEKVVVSTYVAETAHKVFSAPAAYGTIGSLLGVYAFAIQIYMDFAGYTNMAIGLALLLGFRFPQNFDSPYAAMSLQDFWRRWHMTLSRWLRDYLYIPLGGNRRSRARSYVNLMATMVLGGLWHGASWMMIIWGTIHGVGLAVERFITERFRDRKARKAERRERLARLREPLEIAPELVLPAVDGELEEHLSGQRHGEALAQRAAQGVLVDDRPGGETLEEPAAERDGPGYGAAGDGAAAEERPGGTAWSGSAVGIGEGRIPADTPPESSRPRERAERPPNTVGVWIRRFITFHIVCAAWIFFWQGIPGNDGNLHNAFEVFRRLGHWDGGTVDVNWVLVALIVGPLALQFIPTDWSGRFRAEFSKLHWTLQAASLALWVTMCATFLGVITGGAPPPFIYFKF